MKKLITMLLVVCGVSYYIAYKMPVVDLLKETGDHHVFCYKVGMTGDVQKIFELKINKDTNNYKFDPSAIRFMSYLGHCAIHPEDLDSAGYTSFVSK